MPRFRPHKMYPGALLAQECCSYQATTQLLMGMRGDFAVIVHSDRDCSNVIPKGGSSVRSERDYKFFCTNLREDELVTGQGNAKLRRAIELVHEAYHPKLTVVLATCPTVMIGDNIKNVARKAGKDLGTNVVAEMTNGLRPKSPAEIVDDCYVMLSRSATPATGDVEKRVNFVGMRMSAAERAEAEGVLSAMGLTLNVVLNESASLDDFLAVANARFNAHPGPHLMLKFDEHHAAKSGQRAVEIPLPFGVGATDRAYRAIGLAAGVDEATIAAAIEPGRSEAAPLVASFRERLHAEVRRTRNRSPRCGFNIGSGRGFDLISLAHEEMGLLPLFEELGFAPSLFIQGPSDEANQKRTAEILGELGVALPFVIFPDPGSISKQLPAGQLDVFTGVNSLAGQLSKQNLPFVDKSLFRLGYGSTRANLALLENAIFSQFYRHFSAEVVADPIRSLPIARQ